MPRSALRIAVLVGLALQSAQDGASGVAVDSTPLASASVDTKLYRDGEVRRRNEVYGRWSLDCDEIVRLKRRFCSLRSLALDQTGRAAARITISTDDLGRPAALFDFPLAMDLRQPVVVTADRGLVIGSPSKNLMTDTRRIIENRPGAAQGGARPNEIQTNLLAVKLASVLCDLSGCHAVWSMTPADIGALRAGAGLRLRYVATAPGLNTFAAQAVFRGWTVEAVVSSDGLGDALVASIR